MSSFDERVPRLANHTLHSDSERRAFGSSLVAEAAAPVPSTGALTVEPRSQQTRALIWEVVQTVLLTVAIFLSVRMVVQNFRVEGASMDPTLRSGQFLLINKLAYLRLDGSPLELLSGSRRDHAARHYVFDGPQRGDIIVFRPPSSPDKDYIKRVIGLPGERIKIQGGEVFINGQPLAESYLVHRASYDLSERSVPGDSFFVLGDNRPNSSDSHLGWFAEADRVVGRAWVSYWPPDLWGPLVSTTYASTD